MQDTTTINTPIASAATQVDRTQAQDHRPARRGADKLLRVLSFVDLPIKQKFLLMGIGTLFWFFALLAMSVGSLTLLNYQYYKLTRGILHHQNSTAEVMKQWHGLERDMVMAQDMTQANGQVLPTSFIQSMRERLQRVRSIHADLSLRTTQREGTIVESMVRALAADHYQHLEYLKASNAIQSKMETLILGQGLQQKENFDQMERHLAAVTDITQQRIYSLQEKHKIVDQSIYETMRTSVHALLGMFALAVVLLLTFVRWLLKAFHIPIGTLIRQIDALAAGEIDLAKKTIIESADEIGDLSSRLNNLIDRVYGMSLYKKVIEEDSSLSDVYARLGGVFEHDLGIDEYSVYEVDEQKHLMSMVHPPLVGPVRMHCSNSILSDCGQCRAVKTGHRVSSLEYAGICRQFDSQSGGDYVCLPLLTGGRTIGVVQLRFNGDNPGRVARLDGNDAGTLQKIFNASAYIEQSVSVIEAKRLMQTLRESATVDALTGLYNRRFLQDSADQIISGARRRKSQIGLLMCDLDHFKQVNDTHGHDAGDTLLKEVASVLLGSVRESDVVIRFGGEEFLILLIDCHPGYAHQVGDKIRAAVEKMRVKINGEVLHKTISIGAAEFQVGGHGFWQAIKYADMALYQAKRQGRNQVLSFTPEMRPANEIEAKVENY